MWKGWRLATLKTTCPINWQLCQSQRDGCRNQTESTINGPIIINGYQICIRYFPTELLHCNIWNWTEFHEMYFWKHPKHWRQYFFQLKFSVQFFVLNRTALFCIVASFINPLFLLVIQNKIRFTSPPIHTQPYVHTSQLRKIAKQR